MKQFIYIFLAMLFCFSAPTFGLVDSENIYINADVFELDGETKQLLASGNVVVKQKDVTIKSNRATYDQKKQVVNLFDGVELMKDNIILTCKFAIANAKTERIEAHENIRFNFQNMKGKAELALYDMKTQHITLTGSPSAQQGQDIIEADTIIINVLEEKVITKGQAKVKLSVD